MITMHSLIQLAILGLASSANLVLDGSFETAGGTCTVGQCSGLLRTFPWLGNPTFLENSWNAAPQLAEISSLIREASDGNFSMDLNEEAPYTLYQEINGFVVGQAYKMTFDVARNDKCEADIAKTGYARIDGSGLDAGIQFSVPVGQVGHSRLLLQLLNTQSTSDLRLLAQYVDLCLITSLLTLHLTQLRLFRT